MFIFLILLSVNLNPLVGFLTFNKDSKVLTAFFNDSIYIVLYFSNPNLVISLSMFAKSKYIWKSLYSSPSNFLLYAG